MIAFIEGVVEEIGTSELIVNVNGVGYEVFTAHPERFECAQSYRLYTYAVYREDNQQLYGFKELEQRNFFKLLVELLKGLFCCPLLCRMFGESSAVAHKLSTYVDVKDKGGLVGGTRLRNKLVYHLNTVFERVLVEA